MSMYDVCVCVCVYTLIDLCVNWKCVHGKGSMCICCISPKEAAGWSPASRRFSGWHLSESLCCQHCSTAFELLLYLLSRLSCV